MANYPLKILWNSRTRACGIVEHTAFPTRYMKRYRLMAAIRQSSRGCVWSAGHEDNPMCGGERDLDTAKELAGRLLVHMGHPAFKGMTCPYDRKHEGSCNLCFRNGGCELVPVFLDVPHR